MDAIRPLPFTIPGEDMVSSASPPRPVRHGWLLMGDIASARGGVPELLIQWRRAEDQLDPDPQL